MKRTVVDNEIVIVGGGICGLATALALHRKRIKSLVLEKSDELRATGAAIIVQANGWHALDQLGVGSTLRQTAIQIQGGRFISLSEDEPKEVPFGTNGEFRCLKRTDLIKAMANCLPQETICTGCQILSIELDPVTKYPQLLLSNGSILQAKYRPPWELLLNGFNKGTIVVAGDAMHATGPFVAQGGSASIEDAIVLARCLAEKMNDTTRAVVEINVVEEAFDKYVKERRMRIFWLSLNTFLVGKRLDTKSCI
ncbi:hypothetical protein RYX36_012468, partial [Vicia faba]